jgi:hypothetical protein
MVSFFLGDFFLRDKAGTSTEWNLYQRCIDAVMTLQLSLFLLEKELIQRLNKGTCCFCLEMCRAWYSQVLHCGIREDEEQALEMTRFFSLIRGKVQESS